MKFLSAFLCLLMTFNDNALHRFSDLTRRRCVVRKRRATAQKKEEAEENRRRWWFTNNNSSRVVESIFVLIKKECAYERLTTIIFLLVTFLTRMFCLPLFLTVADTHIKAKERERENTNLYWQVSYITKKMNWKDIICKYGKNSVYLGNNTSEKTAS